MIVCPGVSQKLIRLSSGAAQLRAQLSEADDITVPSSSRREVCLSVTSDLVRQSAGGSLSVCVDCHSGPWRTAGEDGDDL